MVYWFETAMTVMASLSDLLIGNTNLENGKRVATEMEKAKRDFETAYTAARNYLLLQRDGYSSVSAESLPSNLVMEDSISDKKEESSKLNRTKSKLSSSMKLYEIPQDSTGITKDTHSCVTEGNKSESKKRSESRKRSQSWKRSQAWKRAHFQKMLESREMSISSKRLKSWDSSKAKKRSEHGDSPKFKKRSKSWDRSMSTKRSKIRNRHKSRKKSKSRKMTESRKRSMSRKRPKFRKRYKSRSLPRKRSKSKQTFNSRKRFRYRKMSNPNKRQKSKTRSRFKRCVSQGDVHIRVGKIQVGKVSLTRPATNVCPLQMELIRWNFNNMKILSLIN